MSNIKSRRDVWLKVPSSFIPYIMDDIYHDALIINHYAGMGEEYEGLDIDEINIILKASYRIIKSIDINWIDNLSDNNNKNDGGENDGDENDGDENDDTFFDRHTIIE